MVTTSYERPGVYSSYEASSVVEYATGRKQVGLVAVCESATPNEVRTITSASDGVKVYGEGLMSSLIGYALQNGALAVVAIAIAEGTIEGYESGISILDNVESLPLIICDSTDLEVQQKIRDHVLLASEGRKERIAIFACGSDVENSAICEQANGLNCERVVLVAGKYTEELGGLYCAAAMAGVVAKESDPALPLNGVSLLGVPTLNGQYPDNELDLLVQGGVTPLEESLGVVSVVRGITTKSSTDGVADSTWRDLSTILIVDEVIGDMRTALRLKFLRVKNTEQTRGAIRTQVLLELEAKKTREIIVDYDGITVASAEGDASICLVGFAFSVAHGLNQIWLTAYVSV
ncbi:MAG: phage tail sheath subtilisin-like domain-containing protein [Eubacteriales bacterium]